MTELLSRAERVVLPRPLRGRRLDLPMIVLAAGAVVLRLYVMARTGGPFGVSEYDDGVHYGVAALLLHGVMPYRGQVFLQPPGVAVALVPFAVVGRLAGDATGLAAARIATCLVGGATTWLVGRLAAARWGRAAGLAAGSVQATAAAALLAESTVMLEPLVGLLTVCALCVLSPLVLPGPMPARAAQRAAVVGALLGIAVTVKAWAVVTLVVLLAWLALRCRSLVWPAVCGAAVAAVAVCAPFLAAAPTAMVHDVVVTQLGRPHDGIGPVGSRLADMVGVRTLLRGHGVGVPLVAAVIGAAVLVAIVLAIARDGFARLTAALFGSGLLMLLLAPVFFTHYADFVVPFLALLAGAAVGGLASARALGSRAALAAGVAVVVALAGVQVSSAVRRTTPSRVDVAALRAAVPAGCVLTETPALAELAGTLTRPRCPVWLDPRGAALARLGYAPVHGFTYPGGFRRLATWQARWAWWASHSRAAVVVGDPCRQAIWTPTVCRFIKARFPRSTVVGTHSGTPAQPVEVWSK